MYSNRDAIEKGALRKQMRNMGKLCSKPQIILWSATK
jgi:hypothetical protein